MRCFVAAWPDQATRESLQELLARLRPQVPTGRPMQTRNLHLTLAFIGELTPAAAEPLSRSVDKLSIDTIRLDDRTSSAAFHAHASPGPAARLNAAWRRQWLRCDPTR